MPWHILVGKEGGMS